MDENKQAQAKQKLNKMERLTMFHQHGFKFKTHSLKSMVDVTRKGDVASLPRHVQAELRSDPFLRFKLPVPDNIGIAEGMPLLTMSEVCYSYSSTTRSAPGPSAKPSSLARALEEKRRSTKAATKMKGAKRSMPDVAANPPHILNNVTLQLTSLSRVAVVGKNGCGKSTLLKLLTGNPASMYVASWTDLTADAMGNPVSLSSAVGGLEPVAGQLWKHHNVKMALVEQHNVEALMEHLDCTPVQLLLDMFSALDGGFYRTTRQLRNSLTASALACRVSYSGASTSRSICHQWPARSSENWNPVWRPKGEVSVCDCLVSQTSHPAAG
eukprot:scaffold3791_cov390-Prasinococcus_capsulatus_cf.AAC.21